MAQCIHCTRPASFLCKGAGRNAWLACGLPEHQTDAEIILTLTEPISTFIKHCKEHYQIFTDIEITWRYHDRRQIFSLSRLRNHR